MESGPLRIERKPITWSTIHLSAHLCIDSSNKNAPGLLMKSRRFSFFPRNGKSEDCFSKEKSGGCAKCRDLKMEFLFFFSGKGKKGFLLINHFKSSHYTSQELCVAQSHWFKWSKNLIWMKWIEYVSCIFKYYMCTGDRWP